LTYSKGSYIILLNAVFRQPVEILKKEEADGEEERLAWGPWRNCKRIVKEEAI